MAETPPAGLTPSLPPATFQETMSVPRTDYQTAIAIKHDVRMSEVSVTFLLQRQDGDSATYAAVCPRCNAGEIAVTVRLDADGRFAEPPACPTLCVACEDRLDAIMEPGLGTSLADQPKDRATLGKYLKAMSTRSWD
jgi:hypothetical protein